MPFLRKHALMHCNSAQFDPNHGMMDVATTLPLVLSIYLRQLLIPVGITGLYYTPYVTSAILSQVVLPVSVLGAALFGLWYWNRREGDSTRRICRTVAAGWTRARALSPKLRQRRILCATVTCICPRSDSRFWPPSALRRLPSIKKWNAQAVQGFAVLVLCGGYLCASLAQQVYWGNDLLLLVRGASSVSRQSVRGGWAGETSTASAARMIERLHWRRRWCGTIRNMAMGRWRWPKLYIHAGRVRRRPRVAGPGESGLRQVGGGDGRSRRALRTNGRLSAGTRAVLENAGEGTQSLLRALQLRQYSPDGWPVTKTRKQLLSRAVQLVPEQAAPKHFLGRALLQDGRNAEAQPYLLQAAAMDPKVWDYHYWLAESLEQAGIFPVRVQNTSRRCS